MTWLAVKGSRCEVVALDSCGSADIARNRFFSREFQAARGLVGPQAQSGFSHTLPAIQRLPHSACHMLEISLAIRRKFAQSLSHLGLI
ncbi:hypothetical protein WJX79_008792 [Trebouxia sp. C0005]